MFDKYVQAINETGITPGMIKSIIDEHKPMHDKTILLKGRYTQDQNVPIFQRKMPEAHDKIDNKLANDWFSEIVDTKTGYLFGVPIDISIDRKVTRADEFADRIRRFRKLNSFDDVISENAKNATIGGYDPLLAYVDTDGNERIMRLDAWETCIITETSVSEPAYALRYYTTHDGEKRAEFYDDIAIQVFAGKSWSELKFVEGWPHMFDYCPLFGVANNDELQGDGEKVLSLIDDYDRVTSDFSSEIEQFRLAYLLLYGLEVDREFIAELKRTGIMQIPRTDSQESEAKVEYLTKNLDTDALNAHLDRLERNIVRFAKHVNFGDAAFGGDLTGPAMRFKLFMLETKSMMMERKHAAAMMYLFKVIGSAWKKKGMAEFDYMDLDFRYSRNIPVNIADQANTAKVLMGMTSQRTMFSVMPDIVPDPDAELRQLEEEGEDRVDLDDPKYQEPTQTGGSSQQTDGTKVGAGPNAVGASAAASGQNVPAAPQATTETGAV